MKFSEYRVQLGDKYNNNNLTLFDYITTMTIITSFETLMIFFLNLVYNNIQPEYVVHHFIEISSLIIVIAYSLVIANIYSFGVTSVIRLTNNMLRENNKINIFDKFEFISYIIISLIIIYLEIFFSLDFL